MMVRVSIPRVLWALAAWCLVAPGAPAQGLSPGAGLLPVTQAFALKPVITTPGVITLHFDIAPNYYLYRGRIEAKIQTPGLVAGALQLPPGKPENDPFLGQVEIYHQAVEIALPFRAVAAMPATVQLVVGYQGCHEVEPQICYPPTTQTVVLPTAGGGPLSISGADGVGAGLSGNPVAEALAGWRAPPPALATPAASAAPAVTAAQDAPEFGLALALLLAFGGGLILNLMPCVLPVLAIKAVGVLESRHSTAQARGHALAYGAGVLASFLVIGLIIVGVRGGGHAPGWGTQLQQPLLVAALALVLFAVGLSMSGLLTLGARLGNLGAGLAQAGGARGHFFTGVLAVIVATPCTAPFMGAALAYAFVAPVVPALGVMLALGLGLALPLVAIGWVPALARLLPRPGAWMESLKQWLAFPMYLSAVWLVWVLGHQRGADAVALLLVAMVLVTAAAWWHARRAPQRRLGLVLNVALLLAAGCAWWAIGRVAPPQVAGAASRDTTFSMTKLQALRAAGTPVFVGIGADWCVSCKANEYLVLDTARFRDLLRRTGTVYLHGDWTRPDPEISTYLQSFASPGVPLYVVYPRGAGPGRALPTLLTAKLVREALETPKP